MFSAARTWKSTARTLPVKTLSTKTLPLDEFLETTKALTQLKFVLTGVHARQQLFPSIPTLLIDARARATMHTEQ
jgi:hypothetical protein